MFLGIFRNEVFAIIIDLLHECLIYGAIMRVPAGMRQEAKAGRKGSWIRRLGDW